MAAFAKALDATRDLSPLRFARVLEVLPLHPDPAEAKSIASRHAQDPHPRVRLVALSSLAALGDAKAADALTEAFDRADTPARLALLSAGAPVETAGLCALASGEETPANLRMRALRAVCERGERCRQAGDSPFTAAWSCPER